MTYVVGFLFNANLSMVALIRKNRPEWQKGKLNGVGGKIEPGESGLDAMIREFKEETGATVEDWLWFEQEQFANGAVVNFYAAVAPAGTYVRDVTDEHVSFYFLTNAILEQCIPNLKYLIPMASHHLDTGNVRPVETGVSFRRGSEQL
jgi:8-oxo-dGTP diphosphatase